MCVWVSQAEQAGLPVVSCMADSCSWAIKMANPSHPERAMLYNRYFERIVPDNDADFFDDGYDNDIALVSFSFRLHRSVPLILIL